MELSDRVAIVTGAGGGIGRAIALALADAGCHVAPFDLDATGAEKTAELARAKGRRAMAGSGSVADRSAVSRFTNLVAVEFGRIDILVNNAGVLLASPFLEVSEADWRTSFAVNLDGAFHFSQEVLPHMVARKGGAIVNMSSWTGKKGVPNHAAYGATKAGLINLTQVLAGEFGGHGIRVN
ncbi:SDR family NAD(P)-dependent oxidoreductase, partial [bacterium]|nr:SDR family NAD(P)-dependent oxidoreductase [bacterium]